MKPENLINFEKNEALAFGSGAVLVALMMFCAGLTVSQFFFRLSPNWDLAFLPWAAMLVAAEAVYSRQIVHYWVEISWVRISYRISELLVILFLLKAIFFVRMGAQAFREEISEYGSDFFAAFFNSEFVALAITCFIIWSIASRLGGFLVEMGRDKEILEPWARPDFFKDRQQVRLNMASLSFFVGAVLIIFATFARAEMKFMWQGAPVVQATALNIIVYFVLSLVLLSMAQFSVLRGRWGWERIPIRRDIGTAWFKYTLLFLGLVFILIVFLPTDYSLSFFETFRILLRVITGVLGFLVFLIILPFLLLINSVLGENADFNFENPFMPILPEAMSPEAVDPIGTGVPVLDWLRSIFFWMVFLFVIFYAFTQYARNNEALWEQLRSVTVFQWMLSAWESVRDWLLGVGRATQALVNIGIEQVRNLGRPNVSNRVWDFIGINRLSARRKVFFFYLAMVRRGREQNVARGRTQTPEEYRWKLVNAYPELANDITALTEEFESARYDSKPVGEDAAEAAKSAWARLRGKLRKKVDG